MSDGLLLHLLLHVARILDERVQGELARVGVSHEQGRYLDALARHGPMPISCLASGLHASQPSGTTMVTRLEALGLVARRPHETDKRVTHVHLTAKGRAAARAVESAWREVEAECTSGLTPDDASALHEALLRLRDRLGGKSPYFPKTSSKRDTQ